ncbi:Dabb family protein [Pelagibius sp. Alg239-R121]|uniref:Dabb family protein n=1 Tax=Pelagibius sp. Alg239-R121 TaxID=2993448 RepID=UPI0024A62473|nr:Dabb family protein [Pelagibius sp. Alg239-R121]
MIRHCVFVRYKAETTEASKREINEGLAKLQDHLEGFLGIEIGANVSPEGLDKGHSEGFIVNFANAAARDTYLSDAQHQAIGAKIVAAAQGGIDGIFVFDMEVTGSE